MVIKFLQKEMWAENFEACDTQQVKYLAFPSLLFQKCHCFALGLCVAITDLVLTMRTENSNFLMYWLMLQVSSRKRTQDFRKGGRKFENNEDQNENFSAQNQVRFPAQT